MRCSVARGNCCFLHSESPCLGLNIQQSQVKVRNFCPRLFLVSADLLFLLLVVSTLYSLSISSLSSLFFCIWHLMCQIEFVNLFGGILVLAFIARYIVLPSGDLGILTICTRCVQCFSRSNLIPFSNRI